MKKNTKIENFGRLGIFEKNSKKAQQKKLVSIMAATITVVVIFMIIFAIFPQFKTQVKSVTKPITDLFKFGQPESKKFEAVAPPNVELAFDTLLNTFNKWTKESAERCLIKIPEFKEFENNCQITMQAIQSKLNMKIECPDEFGVSRLVKQLPPDSNFKIYPCIIDGDIFYNNWIAKLRPESLPEVRIINNLIISDELTMKGNGKTYDLEDEGLKDSSGEISYLFKANSGDICFLTTFDGDMLGICNSNNYGLDDDCIEDLNSKYKIPFCKES